MPRARRWRTAVVVLLGVVAPLIGAPTRAAADVVRVVVERRSVVWEGRTFGSAGSYEMIRARVHLAFDPRNPANAAVVDLALAPRNAEGLVEAAVTVRILQPVEVQSRRGVAWVDLDPGGVGPASYLFAAARVDGALPREGFADGLLLEQGLTLIQLEAGPDGLPVLTGPDGGPITARDSTGGEVIGWVRRQWEPASDVDRLDLDALDGWHHPVAVPEAPVHRLFVGPAGAPAADSVPSEQWRLLPLAGGDDARFVVLEGGFRAGQRYELVYRARTPRVQGLALAAVRDIMAYARYDLRSVFPADRGIAFGSGTSGRLLRQFLRDGFNETGGHPAFDLIWAHGAGAGRGDLNRRFAQPGEEGDLVDLFPFTLDAQVDPASGRDEGLLSRTSAPPRTVFTHAGSDYRLRAASLTHTAVDGLGDLVPGDRHRAYHLAGVAAAAPRAGAPDPDPRPHVRALAVAAIRWVADGVPMPASRLPEVGAGTLVRPGGVATPLADPATPPAAPSHRVVYRVDPGPRFDSLGIADRATPLRGPAFPVLLPQVDGFGNELGGIRPLELRVPLGSYRFDGAGVVLLPFAHRPDEPDGDARPSLASLYGNEGGFLARVRVAVAALIDEGVVLERDRGALIAGARERWSRAVAPGGDDGDDVGADPRPPDPSHRGTPPWPR